MNGKTCWNSLPDNARVYLETCVSAIRRHGPIKTAEFIQAARTKGYTRHVIIAALVWRLEEESAAIPAPVAYPDTASAEYEL